MPRDCQENTKAVKVAQPYFEWIASEAAKKSDLNVLNHSMRLHDRYVFLVTEYKEKLQEAISRKDERIKTEHSPNSWSINMPYYGLRRESEWLALSAIDAFYSFTEHVFIHAAILKGLLLTGEDVANLADKDWASKIKACLDIHDQRVKPHYDRLVAIKRQIRNYMAHGAFGKNGEAFQIHSGSRCCPIAYAPSEREFSFLNADRNRFPRRRGNKRHRRVYAVLLGFHWLSRSPLY